jgi:hypothetical protein
MRRPADGLARQPPTGGHFLWGPKKQCDDEIGNAYNEPYASGRRRVRRQLGGLQLIGGEFLRITSVTIRIWADCHDGSERCPVGNG